jgi:hypothetical protein
MVENWKSLKTVFFRTTVNFGVVLDKMVKNNYDD